MKKKILNNLFNFNIKQKKIILSINYSKKLNYLIHHEKGEMKFFIPFGAKKSLNPYKNIKKKNLLVLNKNNSFSPMLKKSASGTIEFKFNCIKNKTKSNISDKFINQKLNNHIISKYQNNTNMEHNINKSKMIMLFKEEDSNIINKNFKKKKKKIQNLDNISDNNNESLSDVNINLFDYFCGFGKIKSKKSDIELFISAKNFFRNQMSIINIFNIIFLTKIMVTQSNKKIKYLNQTIEIPLKTGK